MLLLGNLLWYKSTKNYQQIAWFDKVIAKIKWCSVLTRMVDNYKEV